MGAEDHDWNHLPWWCWVAPLLAAALVVAKLTHLVAPDGLVFVVLAVALLGGAVFAAVHHAEVLAVRIGEPFGSILLALAITTLEAGLIISVMASGASGSDVVATASWGSASSSAGRVTSSRNSGFKVRQES
jgi:Ca2+:H+ antiporter